MSNPNPNPTAPTKSPDMSTESNISPPHNKKKPFKSGQSQKKGAGKGKSKPPSKRQHLVTPTHVFFYGHASEHELDCFSQWYICSFVAPAQEAAQEEGEGVGDGEGDGERGEELQNKGNSADNVAANPHTQTPTQTLIFTSTEQYMMYHKAILMNDQHTASQILRPGTTPRDAKRLGRQVHPWDEAKWQAHCDGIVERGNMLKFSQNEDIRKALLGTGTKKIVEASPMDRIWGIGFGSDNALVNGNEGRWGLNKLGEALGRVRERLREAERQRERG